MSTAMRNVITLLLAALVSASALAQTGSPRKLQELEEIVVTGRYPGPPLWKVSKGDHALWILPLIDMYPRKMDWDSRRVERLVAQSQEYLMQPSVRDGMSAAVNPLVIFPLIFRANNIYVAGTQLPKGKTLSKMMPAELYRRFQALRSRYFPRKINVDHMTVMMASETLQSEVLERENLQVLHKGGVPPVIFEKLQKWLKANKSIRRVMPSATGPGYALTSKDIKAMTKAMEKGVKSPEFAAWGVECMTQMVTYFERDLTPVKARANAWALGRIEGLINPMPLYQRGDSCSGSMEMVSQWPAAKQLREENPKLFAALTADRAPLVKQSRERWVAAAEKALENNTTTFSMLPIEDVLDKEGLVAQLEAKGYKVEISAE